MPANRKEHLRFRYGICLNDSCSKCKSKEVQQIAARKDFVCEECQKTLRECPPPKSSWDKYGKMIIGGSVAVIVGAAIWYFGLKSNDSEPQINNPIVESVTESPQAITEEVDTTAEANDTIINTASVDLSVDQTDGNPKTQALIPSIQVPFGTYSGPANGLNGEIKVTRSYTLDLRNVAHDSIELLPGDLITHTKFKNGELVSGYWHRGSKGRSFHR